MDTPQRFGRFWLHEKIGDGGMAEVFRASIGPDPHTYAFDCVVKRMHPRLEQEERYVDMFNVEQYLASLLRHPNVIETYEAGTVDGQRYLAMELVRGADLERLLQALQQRSMRLPPELAVYIALQMLRALDYLHRASTSSGAPLELIHRDITPSNVYLGFDGGVKIGDFGVARVRLVEDEQQAKTLKGKPAYMPPEVVAGTAKQCQQDDLWALGICLYEMLTMHQVFNGMSEAEIRDRCPSPRLPPPQSSRAPIDKGLQRILARFLSPNPKKRPQTAAACYGELKRYLRSESIAVERDVLSRFVLAIMGDPRDMARSCDLAIRDGVTGFHNYRHLLEHLQTEIDRAKRYQRVLSLLFLDLDDFGRVTRVHGKGRANEALVHVAGVLKGTGAGLRSSDYVARRGGDKFCIVLPETAIEGAVVTAERLRARIEETDWSSFDARFDGSVTATVGVASYPLHGETVGALLEAVEVARFQGKRGGKNRVVAADMEFGALKKKVGEGSATDMELERWADLNQAYLRARTPQGHRRYQRAGMAVEVTFACQEELIRAYSQDIGGGGMRLIVPGSLQPDALLDLSLQLPGYDEAVVVQARVAWTRRGSDLVGLEFLEMPEEVRDRIDALVWDDVDMQEIC